MTPTMVIAIGREALEVGLLVSAPLFVAALAMGLLISVIQAATQINEMTLSFVPKLLVIFGVMLIAGPWMLTTLVDFMQRLISSIPSMIG